MCIILYMYMYNRDQRFTVLKSLSSFVLLALCDMHCLSHQHSCSIVDRTWSDHSKTVGTCEIWRSSVRRAPFVEAHSSAALP